MCLFLFHIFINKMKKKKLHTKFNEWNSKRLYPQKRPMRVDELNNGVVPKKTLIEIGKGRDKRKIDISQYILK